jgi:hypothetical protein
VTASPGASDAQEEGESDRPAEHQLVIRLDRLRPSAVQPFSPPAGGPCIFFTDNHYHSMYSLGPAHSEVDTLWCTNDFTAGGESAVACQIDGKANMPQMLIPSIPYWTTRAARQRCRVSHLELEVELGAGRIGQLHYRTNRSEEQ